MNWAVAPGGALGAEYGLHTVLPEEFTYEPLRQFTGAAAVTGGLVTGGYVVGAAATTACVTGGVIGGRVVVTRCVVVVLRAVVETAARLTGDVVATFEDPFDPQPAPPINKTSAAKHSSRTRERSHVVPQPERSSDHSPDPCLCT